MATCSKNTVKRVLIRVDTLARWSIFNPVLCDQEISYDTTSRRFKIGDGVTSWDDLAYSAIGGSGSFDPNNIDTFLRFIGSDATNWIGKYNVASTNFNAITFEDDLIQVKLFENIAGSYEGANILVDKNAKTITLRLYNGSSGVVDYVFGVNGLTLPSQEIIDPTVRTTLKTGTNYVNPDSPTDTYYPIMTSNIPSLSEGAYYIGFDSINTRDLYEYKCQKIDGSLAWIRKIIAYSIPTS